MKGKFITAASLIGALTIIISGSQAANAVDPIYQDGSEETSQIEVSLSTGKTMSIDVEAPGVVPSTPPGASLQGFPDDLPLGQRNVALPEKYLNAEPLPVPDFFPDDFGYLDGIQETEEATGSMGTQSVIGTDDRYQITATRSAPWNQMPKIYATWDGSTYYACSGWQFSTYSVATAGHCLYDYAMGGFPIAVELAWGIQNGTSQYLCTIDHMMVPSAFQSTTPSYTDDWGIIQTNCAVGSANGALGYGIPSVGPGGGAYAVSGWPGDKPTNTMWESYGAVVSVDNGNMWYSLDTEGGQSGSPVWKYLAGCGFCAHGIHTYGTGLPAGSLSSYNAGTRINNDVFSTLNIYQSWVIST